MVKVNANKTIHITNHSYLNYIIKLKRKINIKINDLNVKNEYIHISRIKHFTNHLYILTTQYNTNHLIINVLELGWGLGELLSSDVTRSVMSHVSPSVFFAERLLRLVGYLQMALQRSSQWGIVFGWLEYCR